jgi:hypothetical protein
MEEPVSNVLDAISPEPRSVIEDELAHRNPALLAELRGAQEPTTDQCEAVEDVLAVALTDNFGPTQAPNVRGSTIERAIDAFFEAWPINR